LTDELKDEKGTLADELTQSIDLPTIVDADGDAFELTLEGENSDQWTLEDTTLTIDMAAFYEAALQDESAEFVFEMELILVDTEENENRYSVTFNVAPKGDYVERVLALKELEPEEEEVEEEPEPEPVEEKAEAASASSFDGASLFIKPKRKARKNMPVEVLAYDDPSEMFEKVEPTLRKMNIDKKGVNEINFSSEMQFPDNWIDKHDSYLDS